MVRLVPVVAACAFLAACASAGGVPRPFPVPGGRQPARIPETGEPATAGAGSRPGYPPDAGLPADGYAISSTALAYQGVPYRNGGSDPAGFDCSGFVQYVFVQHGIAMPRDVQQQFAIGREIDPAALVPGDLVFFTTVAPGASHVGISIGGDQFVHAPSTSGVVRVEHLGTRYWSDRFVGARRVN